MNADSFRHLYGYHFSENRAMWDRYVASLTQEQFTQEAGYSHGSVRNQLVHMVSADQTWFTPLRGLSVPDMMDPARFDDRNALRAYWDGLEGDMRAYLAALRDDMLFTRPFGAGEDENLILWQVLIHVVNHGTDHRAQLLRLLNDMGVKTVSQDYIFYVYDHP
ncbi:MAG TPA: DinB family protein [Anaerolineales bacterium]|nr:DinB family protein [Anaerolineales bacterium]